MAGLGLGLYAYVRVLVPDVIYLIDVDDESADGEEAGRVNAEEAGGEKEQEVEGEKEAEMEVVVEEEAGPVAGADETLQ